MNEFLAPPALLTRRSKEKGVRLNLNLHTASLVIIIN